MYKYIPTLERENVRKEYAAFLGELLNEHYIRWKTELKYSNGITLTPDQTIPQLAFAIVLGYPQRKMLVVGLEARPRRLVRALKGNGFKPLNPPQGVFQKHFWMSKPLTETREIPRQLKDLEYRLQ